MNNNFNFTKRAASFFSAIALLVSAPAMAVAPNVVINVPEPGILSLFSLGGVAMVVIAIRKRRNKQK